MKLQYYTIGNRLDNKKSSVRLNKSLPEENVIFIIKLHLVGIYKFMVLNIEHAYLLYNCVLEIFLLILIKILFCSY